MSSEQTAYTSNPGIPFTPPPAPQAPHDHFAFIGLGNMGSPMALNLARHLQETGQPPLVVWNRSKDRVDRFLEKAEKEGVKVEVGKDLKEIGRRSVKASFGH